MQLYGPTNGYDLEAYQDLLGTNKINNLQVTIDGIRTVHNQSRKHIGGKDTFDKIVSNIDYCLEKGIGIIARTNLTRKTVPTALELIDFYKEKEWINNKKFTYSFSPVMFCEDSMTYSELFQKLNDMGIPVEILLQHVSQYLGVTRKLKYLIENEHLVIFQPEGCTSCYNSFIVAPDKRLYTCGDFLGSDDACGSLVKGRFEFNNLHEKWNSRYVPNMSKCTKCVYALYCGGSCASICIHNGVSLYTSLCNSFPKVFDKCLANIVSDKIPKVI